MTPVDGQSPDPENLTHAKAALRRTLRERRARYLAAMQPSARALAFRLLPSPVIGIMAPGATVALYHATTDEAPTAKIAAQLDMLGFRLALPRLDRDSGAMHFARWDREQILVPGPFRTLQPSAEASEARPDIIIAPLIGFDHGLNRLGQGGGYYDRAFEAHPHALRIGLAWSVQQVDSVPAEGHDLPLDLIVTEAAILERGEVER
ncbi:MAG: 5-formyltetrahydrofolate cyclo-ligase [Sphingobium sp.]